MHEQFELGLSQQESPEPVIHYICSTNNAPDEIYVTTDYNGKDFVIIKGPLEYIHENSNLVVRIGDCVIATIYKMQTTINYKLFGGHSAISLLNFLSDIRRKHGL